MDTQHQHDKNKKKEFRIRTVREVLEEVAKGGAKKEVKEKDETKTQEKKEATAATSFTFDNIDVADSFVWHI
jgi:hypothetical protein